MNSSNTPRNRPNMVAPRRARFRGRPWTTLIVCGFVLLVTGMVTAFRLTDPDNAAAGYAFAGSLTGISMLTAGFQWALETARNSYVIERQRNRSLKRSMEGKVR